MNPNMPIDRQNASEEGSINPIELEKAENFFWANIAKHSEDFEGLERFLEAEFNF